MPVKEISVETNLPPAHKIIEAVMNYRASKVLLVSVYFDLFTSIDRGLMTSHSLSELLHLNKRALELLLDSLVSLGYLTKLGDRYNNTLISKTYLVKSSSSYLGNNLKYQEIIWDAWSDLRSVLKEGRPKIDLSGWLENEEFLKDYIQGMDNIAKKPAQEIVSFFDDVYPTSILDVGAGPGAYALAFLRRFPSAQATLLDLPSTIKLTRELLRGHADEGKINFVEGDYHSFPFDQNEHDVVIMSHITHDEGADENLNLIKKGYAALRPGGKIVIHDFMSEENQTSTPFISLFSVHMLVYTQNGRVYSTQTYRQWMEQAGFKFIEEHDVSKGLPNSSKVLIGVR